MWVNAGQYEDELGWLFKSGLIFEGTEFWLHSPRGNHWEHFSQGGRVIFVIKNDLSEPLNIR